MTESSDVQALAKISTEVDESQIKVVFSSQCIKAQAFLTDKLRKQSERQKEICAYVSSANMKLESEIKLAEQEIQSLQISHETIRNANVQLKKELLLTKDKKLEILQRIKSNENKYEDLWLECKKRYESIPYVKKLMQAKTKISDVGRDLNGLQNQAKELVKEIEMKKDAFATLDKKRIVELAEFIVNEMPKELKFIEEMSDKIAAITKDIDELTKEQTGSFTNNLNANIEDKDLKTPDENKTNDWLSPVKDNDVIPLFANIPKFESNNFDFEAITLKLEQIKKADLSANVTEFQPLISKSANKPYWLEGKPDEYLSTYFSKPSYVDRKMENYSKNKLINILEDIQLDKNDALNLVSKVIPEKLQPVDVIAAEDHADEAAPHHNNTIEQTCGSVEITEINASPDQDIIIPPTQFSDLKEAQADATVKVQEIEHVEQVTGSKDKFQEKLSQETKKVSFDLTPEIVNEEKNYVEHMDVDPNETVNSQLNTSVVSEDGYAKIKDMILKKHHLDSSPQFVYAKNTMLKNDTLVTSKFFQENVQREVEVTEVESVDIEQEKQEQTDTQETEECEIQSKVITDTENKESEVNIAMDVDVAETTIKTNEIHKLNMPVKGFLFNHGAQEYPDSLDVSISTTGFEDGDPEFPHCLDSSLLLSPKADQIAMSSDNVEVQSQEVPNFLSGLRKTGLSFFGGHSSVSENKDNSNTESQGDGGFTFNFGGDKKKRGGLFSMFQ